jgi:hypothetical protein
MNKITPEHLARDAYVYVRQSTADQLLNNPESRRRQYALVRRQRHTGRMRHGGAAEPDPEVLRGFPPGYSVNGRTAASKRFRK